MGVSPTRGGVVSSTRAVPDVRGVRVPGDQRFVSFDDLSEHASTETAMLFGELHRDRGERTSRAVGPGCTSGLRGTAPDSGVDVGRGPSSTPPGSRTASGSPHPRSTS